MPNSMQSRQSDGGAKRYGILLGAVLLQLCLGATYSWSVFVTPLKEASGLLQGAVQLPFSLFYFAFPATMIASGTFLRRFGPRRMALLGGTLFGAGWLLASLGDTHFLYTVLGIGLVAGVGVGLAYVVPIAVCVQWFPEHKGLVTGIAVAGFGGGAAIVSYLAGSMINEAGASPYGVFRVLGAAFLLVSWGAGATMQFAPAYAKREAVRIEPSWILKQRSFRILYGAMVTGLAAGFAVNANLKEFLSQQNSVALALAVPAFAVANATGRITWGFLFDRLKPASVMGANLSLQALVTISGFWLSEWGNGILLFALLTGFNYGGVLVLYASAAAHLWGVKNVGQVYGLLFSANIVAAPSPVLAGIAHDSTGDFTVAAVTLTILLLCAAFWVRSNRSRFDSALPPPGAPEQFA